MFLLAGLETEPNAVFFPVNRLSQYRVQVPVTVKISAEYVQIMTVRKQELFYNMSAVTNDVFHVSDIEDLAVGQHGRETENPNEFSFKYNKGKAQMTLSSPKRDTMINVCYYKIHTSIIYTENSLSLGYSTRQTTL